MFRTFAQQLPHIATTFAHRLYTGVRTLPRLIEGGPLVPTGRRLNVVLSTNRLVHARNMTGRNYQLYSICLCPPVRPYLRDTCTRAVCFVRRVSFLRSRRHGRVQFVFLRQTLNRECILLFILIYYNTSFFKITLKLRLRVLCHPSR